MAVGGVILPLGTIVEEWDGDIMDPPNGARNGREG